MATEAVKSSGKATVDAYEIRLTIGRLKAQYLEAESMGQWCTDMGQYDEARECQGRMDGLDKAIGMLCDLIGQPRSEWS
jgi:hypothetical protein